MDRPLRGVWILALLVSGNLVATPRSPKLPIEQFRLFADNEYPNGPPSDQLPFDPEKKAKLFEKANVSMSAARVFLVDINNDGTREYVIVRNEPAPSGENRDVLGPVFRWEESTHRFEAVRLPPIPTPYTNVLLPVFQQGKRGLQVNLHHFSRREHAGKPLDVSRRMAFVWQGDRFEKISEKWICDDVRRCTGAELSGAAIGNVKD